MLLRSIVCGFWKRPLWMRDGPCFIGSWLRLPRSLLIMVNGVGRPRIPLFGIKKVAKSNASLSFRVNVCLVLLC